MSLQQRLTAGFALAIEVLSSIAMSGCAYRQRQADPCYRAAFKGEDNPGCTDPTVYNDLFKLPNRLQDGRYENTSINVCQHRGDCQDEGLLSISSSRKLTDLRVIKTSSATYVCDDSTDSFLICSRGEKQPLSAEELKAKVVYQRKAPSEDYEENIIERTWEENKGKKPKEPTHGEIRCYVGGCIEKKPKPEEDYEHNKSAMPKDINKEVDRQSLVFDIGYCGQLAVDLRSILTKKKKLEETLQKIKLEDLEALCTSNPKQAIPELEEWLEKVSDK